MKGKTAFLSVFLLLAALPFFAPPVHASSWQCNPQGTSCSLPNTYNGQCLLNTGGDNSTYVSRGGFGAQDSAFSSRGAYCDGVGYLTSYATAGFPYGDVKAHARIVFTDTFAISNYGQTSTTLTVGADYLIDGYLYTSGVGALISSSAEVDVQFNLTGPGKNVSFEQNAGQPWSAPDCFSTPQGNVVSWPPDIGYCRDQWTGLKGDLYFNLNSFEVTPGTWTLSMIVETNSTAYTEGYGQASGSGCFVSNVNLGCPASLPNGCNLLGCGCPLIGCRPQPPAASTGCPSEIQSPCYFVQWKSTTYRIDMSYAGTPDFLISITPATSYGEYLLDENPSGLGDQITVSSINGFSGYVNLYFSIIPNATATAPPVTYFTNPNTGALEANGTAFWVSPTSSLRTTLNEDPCASEASSPPSFCTNGYCALFDNPPGQLYSSSCGSNYRPVRPATQGVYFYKIIGVSGGLTHTVDSNFSILFYDFAVKNVGTTYSNGVLSVNATLGNIGNASPHTSHFCLQLCPKYSWGEYVSYYLDGVLQNSVPLCGQLTPPFLNFDCPPGQTFNYVWRTSTTSGSHNVTVTAVETAPCCTTPGNFFDTINANNNRFDSNFLLSPPVSWNPPLLTSPGGSGQRTTTFAAFPDFAGTVSVSGTPPTGWGLSFDSTSVLLNPSQHSNITATISVPSSTPSGNYTVTITGASVIGGQTVTHSINILVQVSDFSISAVPVNLNTNPGMTASWIITATSLNRFTGTVTLTDNTFSGLACSSIYPSSISLTVDRTFGQSVLSCSASQATYGATLTGTSGSLSHSVNLTFNSYSNTPDFSISSNQNTQSSFYGSTGPVVGSNILVSSLNGLTGTIGLSYFVSSGNGLGCTLSPASVSLTSTSTSGTSVLSCSGSQGFYNVTVYGTSGPLGHALTLPYTVMNQTMSFGGVTATVNSIFTLPSPTAKTIYGTTTFVETNSSTGAGILWTTLPMSLSSADNVKSKFVVETPNTPFWLSADCVVNIIAASSCGFERTLDLAYARSGTVGLVDIGVVDYQYGRTPSDPNWNPVADLHGDGIVTLSDVSIEDYYYGTQIFDVAPFYFTVTDTPTSITIPVGSNLNFTSVYVSSYNSWTGQITYKPGTQSQTSPFGGPSCYSSTPSASVNTQTPTQTTTTCSDSGLSPGVYSALQTVSVSNYGFGMSVVIHVNVTDFSISANPSTVSFLAGSSNSTTLNLSSLYGFSGTVNLSVPSPPAGLSVACTSSVSLSAARSSSASCTFSSSNPGTYTVSILATSRGISHTISLTVTVK